MKDHRKTKRLVFDAMFVALYVVLGSSYFSIQLANMKITLAGLPIVLGGLLFGPADGFLIGMVGSFVNQMLSYGFSATTLLWILPAGVRGLVSGWYAKKHGFRLSTPQLAGIVFSGGYLTTVLNTLVLYVDSRLFGYYTQELIFGSLLYRILAISLSSLVYVLLLVPLLRRVSPHAGSQGEEAGRVRQ